MKLKKVFLAAVMTLTISCAVPSLPFQSDNLSTVQAATKVKLNVPNKYYLVKGQSKTFRLLNKSGSVKWLSSRKNVATVTNKGVVKARRTGTTTITALSNGKKYKCIVYVEAPKFSCTKATLTKGQTKKLTLKNTKQKIKWASSNRSVATVSSSGVVKAKKAGTAKITAAISTKKYICYITVRTKAATPATVKVKGVSLNYSSLTITENQTMPLIATVTPTNAANKAVTWTSSNPSVASVDSSGKVRGLAPGNTIITVKTKDGSYKSSCSVTVTRPLTRQYNRIKNYIIQNGKTNTKNNKFITWETVYDGDEYSWAIIYERATDRLNFLFLTDGFSTSGALDMYIDLTVSDYVSPNIVFLFNEYSLAFQTEGRILASSYTEQTNVNFKILSASDGLSYKNIQELSNAYLQLALVGWDSLLDQTLNLSMADLGFYSYTPE